MFVTNTGLIGFYRNKCSAVHDVAVGNRSFILDATKQLHKRVCPSVRLSRPLCLLIFGGFGILWSTVWPVSIGSCCSDHRVEKDPLSL